MNNRTTLFDNGDFSLQAHLSAVRSPINGYAFSITSQRRESSRPHEAHVRFFACLDRSGLLALSELLSMALHDPQQAGTP